MAQQHLRHIFLLGPTRTEGFTNPRKGRGSTPSLPERERAAHSDYLQKRFKEAWDSEEQRQAVSVAMRKGTYIEFVSEPGFELTLSGLENIRSGIRLLNIQRHLSELNKEQTLATVYVPHNRRSYFIKKIKDYAEKEVLHSKESHTPRNAKLINSISDIRLSVLKSFWQDNAIPMPGETATAVEIWLSTDDVTEIKKFNDFLDENDIKCAEGFLRFPERTVEIVYANEKQLQVIIEGSDDVAEFRGVSPLATHILTLENKEQAEIVQLLKNRSIIEPDKNVRICILDTGVNNGHSLIKPVLDDDDLHTVRTIWGTNDHDGHGTLMAGTAIYGDVLAAINNHDPIHILHRLESSKIKPPTGQNDKELWGFITSEGVSRAEIQAPNRKRITCLAVTSIEDRDRGNPSSWSAELDAMSSGYSDNNFRLILVSAGNIEDSDDYRNYPASNLTNEIHDPGQAWNALTVGAFTEKTTITDPGLTGFTPIAPAGGLSPYSTTSCTWSPRKWPIKPEIVLEGGNISRGPNDSIFDCEDLKLISTSHEPKVSQFAPFYATSAASAQASWMAAQIQYHYPDAWPETVRALLVHSAKWTDALTKQFLSPRHNKSDYAELLRICGYGVPVLEDAIYCASNSLTLISQAQLQPFDKKSLQYVTNEMHLYKLPWPSEVLSELDQLPITMRVTLSYFIEPGPGKIGWENRYRYPSHGLRFDLNGPTESENDFIKRVNKQARDEEDYLKTEGPGSRWTIGDARNVGSIHSDMWYGPAAELAASNMIAIYPTIGWWRERHYLNQWNKKCRYSLIVSIYSTKIEVDIYTPVSIQVGIPIPIEIK